MRTEIGNIRRRWARAAVLLLLVFASTPLPAPPERFPAVDFTGARQVPEPGRDGRFYARLGEVPYDPLSTTLLTADHRVVPATARATWLLLGGIGAKTSAFGIGSSVAPVANKLLALDPDLSVLGAENPVYFRADLGDAHRNAVIARFGTMPGQIGWMDRFVSFGRQNAEGIDGHRIYLSSRSSSAATALQMLHEYIAGTPGAVDVSGLSGVLVTGLLDPSPRLFPHWFKLESDYLVERGWADLPALETDRAIYGASEWAPDERLDEIVPLSSTGLTLPKVWIIVGAEDPMLTVEQQLNIVDRMHRRMPQLDVTVYVLPSFHTAERSVKYEDIDGKTVKFGTMKLFGPVLEHMTREEKERRPTTPGLRKFVHEAVKRHKSVARCGTALALLEGALPWPPPPVR